MVETVLWLCFPSVSSVPGAMITGPSPFDTDGSRELLLQCVASNEMEVTKYTWSDVCLQETGSLCKIRPQPPWDDGKNITCIVNYRNGQSAYATFVINLNCKYLLELFSVSFFLFSFFFSFSCLALADKP